MSRLSFLFVILALLFISVSATRVSVDVNVDAPQKHHPHPHHTEAHQERNEIHPLISSEAPIEPESEVDSAEAEVDSAQVVEGEVPVQRGKAPEKSHVVMSDDSDVPVVGAGSGPNQKCQVNTAGTNLVKSFEGFVGHWYNDGTGVMTIGYGCTSECKGIKSITEPEAAKKLNQLLNGRYAQCVRNAIRHHLTTNQFAALTSFVYNVGCGGVTGSVGTALNAGNLRSATQHMASWNRAGGRVMAGLVRRRTAEIKLFNTASAMC